jgi:hypothetical protein
MTTMLAAEGSGDVPQNGDRNGSKSGRYGS